MRRPKIAHYYGRLKVAPDAPPEVIRAAYRALVQKYHPDRHRGSLRHEQVLAALNKAHDVLLDPARRAAHDEWIRREELRLGLRKREAVVAPDLGTRLRLLRASVREDGLPVGEASRLHLSPSQRAAFALAACVLVGALVCGLLGGFVLLARWSQQGDALQRVIPPALLSAGSASAP